VDLSRIVSRCTQVLGECTVVADRSMSHGEAIVLELEDSSGRGWIAKHIVREKKYRQELAAYRDWVRMLESAAPSLHSAHDELNLLLLTKVSGTTVEGSRWEYDPAVYHRIGELTRLLHISAAPVADEDFAENLADRLEDYIFRGAHLLTPDEVDCARAQVGELADLPPVITVPCHLDNHPRNWLVDEDGTVKLIDFGHAKMHPWVTDTNRMDLYHWRESPELREAFFDGYGMRPTEDDMYLYRLYLAYHGVTTIVWAHEHGDPKFAAEGRAWLSDLMP
jgi:Ser/Thr protein kinase RdoA (MazF antagonist)